MDYGFQTMRMTITSNSTAEIPELIAIKEYSLIELPAPGRPSVGAAAVPVALADRLSVDLPKSGVLGIETPLLEGGNGTLRFFFRPKLL